MWQTILHSIWTDFFSWLCRNKPGDFQSYNLRIYKEHSSVINVGAVLVNFHNRGSYCESKSSEPPSAHQTAPLRRCQDQESERGRRLAPPPRRLAPQSLASSPALLCKLATAQHAACCHDMGCVCVRDGDRDLQFPPKVVTFPRSNKAWAHQRSSQPERDFASTWWHIQRYMCCEPLVCCMMNGLC